MLTKQETTALRGFAILGIMLHNYTHWLGEIVKENEYTFTEHNARRLMMELSHPSWELIVHLLSFFGHYGVPVFLFLSAYGLVCKYERGANTTNNETGAFSFIWSHYRKLFMLMVGGYAAFVMVDYMTPQPRHYEFWNVVGQLGMFSNLYSNPDHVIWPGPYWYFGLMVQIYMLYRLVLYRGKGSLCGMMNETWSNVFAVILAVVCMESQLLFNPEGEALEWYRYNMFGGVAPFVAGLLYARSMVNNTYPRWTMATVCILSMVCILGGSLAFHSWCWVPLFVCLFAVTFIKIVPQRMFSPIVWVGTISAAMFVTHPIARKVIIPISRGGDLFAGLLLYVVVAIILAVLFEKIRKVKL